MGVVDNKGLAKLEWSLDKYSKVVMAFSIAKHQVIIGVWGSDADVLRYGTAGSRLCGVGIHESFI